jgi:hypothetical protein
LASPLLPPLPAFPPLPPLPAVFTCVFSEVLEFEWLWLDACEELAELLCALRAEGAGAAAGFAGLAFLWCFAFLAMAGAALAKVPTPARVIASAMKPAPRLRFSFRVNMIASFSPCYR